MRKGYGGDLRVQRADAHSGFLQNAINSSIFISCGIVKGQTVVALKEVMLPFARLRRLLTSGGARIHFCFCNGTNSDI